jgi:hypothetical protein
MAAVVTHEVIDARVVDRQRQRTSRGGAAGQGLGLVHVDDVVSLRVVGHVLPREAGVPQLRHLVRRPDWRGEAVAQPSGGKRVAGRIHRHLMAELDQSPGKLGDHQLGATVPLRRRRERTRRKERDSHA